MSIYSRKSLQTFIDDLAAKKPVPGGGSAAAGVAAIAVALGSMAARFTVGNPKYKSVNKSVAALLAENERLRKQCLRLIDEDITAYAALNKALCLPKEDARRARLLQRNLVKAAAVPYELCVVCGKAMKLCGQLAKKGNVNLLTDAGCSAVLLESAFESAALNVRINLKHIKNKRFADNKRKALRKISGAIAAQKKDIINCVEKVL